MINVILFALLIPGSAFVLFAVYGMWRAFQGPPLPQQPQATQGQNRDRKLTGKTSGKCPECDARKN